MEKQISITKIKIRHSQILLFLNCPKKPETLQGELRFQNAWLNFCHPVAFYPVGKSLVCPINTDKLENYDGDWKLTIQDSNDTYTPVFTSRIRLPKERKEFLHFAQKVCREAEKGVCG